MKLPHLRGSRILEDQDITPSWSGVHSKPSWKKPFSQLSLFCSTSWTHTYLPPYSAVLSCRHITYVHTHIHSLSATWQLSRPGVSKSTSIPSWPTDGNSGSTWGRTCPRSHTRSEIQLMYIWLHSLRFKNGEIQAQRGKWLARGHTASWWHS